MIILSYDSYLSNKFQLTRRHEAFFSLHYTLWTACSAILRFADDTSVLFALSSATSHWAITPIGPIWEFAVNQFVLILLLVAAILSDLSTCLHAVVHIHKVVSITPASSVRELLTASFGYIIGVSIEAASTGSILRCLNADLFRCLCIKSTFGTLCAVLLLVHLDFMFAFGELGSSSSKKSGSNLHSRATRWTARTPVTPLCHWTHWIRHFNVRHWTLRLHAFLLLHHGDVGTLLSAHVIDECPCSHRDSNSTGSRTLGPFGPLVSPTYAHSLSSIVHRCSA